MFHMHNMSLWAVGHDVHPRTAELDDNAEIEFKIDHTKTKQSENK